MEDIQRNDSFIPKDQSTSTSLIKSVKQNIEKEKGLKPWWYPELDRLSSALDRLRQNQGVRVGDCTTQNDVKELRHPRDVDEAVTGRSNGIMKYYAWTQSCFVQFGQKKIT